MPIGSDHRREIDSLKKTLYPEQEGICQDQSYRELIVLPPADQTRDLIKKHKLHETKKWSDIKAKQLREVVGEWLKGSPELKNLLEQAKRDEIFKREWRNCKDYNRKPRKPAAGPSAGPSKSSQEQIATQEGTKKVRIADMLNPGEQGSGESDDQPSDEHPT